MQTTNTMHVQLCSEPGCLSEALITCAFGVNVTAVKGWCSVHVSQAHALTPRQQEKEKDNEILRSLGFTV